MPVRKPAALHFYQRECSPETINKLLKGFKAPLEPAKIIAGIVPHAGWVYSGRVAAKVFECIKEKNNPDTFILLGAIHVEPEINAVYSSGSWATPFGEVEVDSEIAQHLLKRLKGLLVEDENSHRGEHSIEVQLPLIKYFFPKAKIVPIRIVPDPQAENIGKGIAEVVKGIDKEIVVIGTTDLTHYGEAYGFTPWGYGLEALEKMKENDKRFIDLTLKLEAEKIVEEASLNYNACGSGAVAATVAYVLSLKARKGYLVDYSTSFDIEKEKEFSFGVGYAGIVF